jgi:hypothetical protein
MQPELKTRLYEILLAIEDFDACIGSGEKNLDIYYSHPLTRPIIEHELENIENELLDLVDDDNNISDKLIWQVLAKYIPRLKKALDAVLNDS